MIRLLMRNAVVFCCLCLMMSSSYGVDVKIDSDTPFIMTKHEGKLIKVQRIQDQSHVISGGYAKTSRRCPPFCIQPMIVAEGVNTVGELELLDFMATKVNDGTGVLVDARTPAWFEKVTIPGSINVPFGTFDPETSLEDKVAALTVFGVVRKDNSGSLIDSFSRFLSGAPEASKDWDFSHAKELVLWCNGLWCEQSPRAIKGLMTLGYPAEKLHYYRGGMQAWQSLGLTVVTPTKP